MKKQSKAIRFCLICKSTNIVPYAGLITGSLQCKKCGYVGNLFPEKVVNKKSFKS